MKKAIITVIGKDKVGIIHGVTHILAQNNVNILDISQTILNDMFTMMMLVDVDKCNVEFTALSEILSSEGKNNLGVEIKIQLEEIFQAMHRI